MIWPPSRDPLEGRIVRMEPLELSHLAGIREAGTEADVWRWMFPAMPEDPRHLERWLQARLAAREAGTEWGYATLRGEQLIGSSSYLAIRPEHDGLEIGWTWLNSSMWRTGANVEAKLLMLRLAIETLGCMRVEFKTDARNERSRGALTALGATFEGIFHRHMVVPGNGVRDSAYYAITDEEWPRIKAALEERVSRHLDAASGPGAPV